MTAKKPSRSSKQQAGGRVTAKGTKPAVTGDPAGDRPTGAAPAARPASPRTDPVKGRQFNGHAGPSRSAHRGNR